MFPSVNVIIVPAVSDGGGHPACATKSKHFITCAAQASSILNLATTNYAANASTNSALYFTGINSNAERYFDVSPKNGSATIDVVPISFSTPFVYTPLSDQFPSSVFNENLGYVPQTLIEWMAHDLQCVSKFPDIASCLPGGPSVNLSAYFCPTQAFPEPMEVLSVLIKATNSTVSTTITVARTIAFSGFTNALRSALPERDLTTSTTSTVAGKGCFHPGACPATAAPGATAVAATAEVTHEPGRLQEVGTSKTAPTPDGTFSRCHSKHFVDSG